MSAGRRAPGVASALGARVVASAALGLLLVGCVRTPFERQMRAGRWSEALVSFTADSSLHDDARALRLAARVYAWPDSAMFDPVRAAELFGAARTRDPNGLPMPDARVERILQLLNYERAWHATVERALRSELARLDAQSDSLRREHAALLGAVVRDAEERRALAGELLRLETELRQREGQVASLQSELERLKAIDLTGRQPLREAMPPLSPMR